MGEVINIIGQGVTDPHIRIFNDRAYLYASQDHSIESDHFVMKDWKVWSSDNLLEWKHESTLKPENTYIGQPSDGCWATDAIEKDGKYYWCFSRVDKEANLHQVGIVVGDSPTGPWKDVLQRPLLEDRCVDTEVYDPCLFKDDDGTIYILFGVWDYFIAQMAEDMLSIAEAPRKIEIINPEGPYGKNKTDDKVFLHKYRKTYYLSWGSYYATSCNIDGPYTCMGSFVDPELMEKRFKKATWPHGPTQGRHGSFFEWNNQWFFTYCEMCFSGNRYYRDFWISYVHYRDNGVIEPIRIDSNAVGTYQASRNPIPACDYFKAHGVSKEETQPGEYEVWLESIGSSLEFPNVKGAADYSFLSISVRAEGTNPVLVIHGKDKKLLEMNLGWISGNGYQTINCPMDELLEDPEHLKISLSGEEESRVAIKWLQLIR